MKAYGTVLGVDDEAQTPLVAKQRDPLRSPPSTSARAAQLGWALTAALVVLGLASGSLPRQMQGVAQSLVAATHATEASVAETSDKMLIKLNTPFNFSVTNEYTRANGPLGLDYPWVKDRHAVVVEPYRAHELVADAAVMEACAELGRVEDGTWSCNVTWAVTGAASGHQIASLAGDAVEYRFHQPGEYTLTARLEVQSRTDTARVRVLAEKSVLLICKYVRREARALSDADRDAFTAALRTTYDTSLDKGRALYGDEYQSMQYFVTKHTELAGDGVCDHVHEGLGFLTNHVALTIELERVLQLISPETAMPYWDYSIDASRAANAATKDAKIHAWRASELFADAWFGTSSPDGDERTMTAGVFASLTVPHSHDANFSTVTNAYGYLRAPWNCNKQPFVARANNTLGFTSATFPSCSDYHTILNSDTWETFGMDIANAPHGPIHSLLGGAWSANGNGFVDSLVGSLGVSIVEALTTQSLSSYPQYWRSSDISCPSYCSLDSPESDCTCSCGSASSNATAAYELLVRTGTFARIAAMDPDQRLLRRTVDSGRELFTWVNDGGESMNEWLVELNCHVANTGEMLGSGAPSDPIFWVVHPAVDRIWQWKRLSSCPYDYSWPVGVSIYGDCWGHDEEDVLPYYGLAQGESRLANTTYTNKAVYNLVNPRDSAIPYIYDNFAWSHCALEGSDVRGFCQAGNATAAS